MAAQHLEAVIEIERVGFSNPWLEGDFQYALAREKNCCFVALDGDVLIGYVVGFQVGHEYHLADFSIHPSHQRKGFGKELLRRILELLKAKRVRVVTLEVRSSNQRALLLYGKAGFHTVAVRTGYYSKPKEDAFVMIKALEGELSNWVGDLVGAMTIHLGVLGSSAGFVLNSRGLDV